MIAVDSDAEKQLWQYVFDLDLVTSLSYANNASDSLITCWANDPRKIKLSREDSLWVRLVDVEKALPARRYATAGQLTIAVRDATCSWNSAVFELNVNADGQAETCQSDKTPQIELDVRELGALYLGGRSWLQFADAGLIRGEVDSLWRAEAMFRCHPQPWCPEIF